MIYRFPNCVLDNQLRELTVGGAPVHLEPQVFDLLRYLVESRDRVVSRDELVDAVWQGRIVSEATIGARIFAARQAVGDTGEAQAVIRTLPRRGFRFVAPVTAHDCWIAAAEPSQEGRRPAGTEGLGDNGLKGAARPVEISPAAAGPDPGSGLLRLAPGRSRARFAPRPRLRLAIILASVILLLAGAGVVGSAQFWQPRIEAAAPEQMAFPLPEKPSIAVLPFANLSSDAEQDLMDEGLTESLINALARNPSLFVIAHSSASTYAGQAVTAKQAAEELGVRYIVEGSVKSSANRARVTAQLVDALRGSVLWSERYQQPADDLLALEEDITAQIARSLDVRIVSGSDGSLGGTRSLEAWTAYVRGRNEYLKFSLAGKTRAREHYRRAIELDPNYAEAIVALANTHLIGMAATPAEKWDSIIVKIEELDRQAAEIAPHMPRLRGLRAMLALTRGDQDQALAEAEAMAALDPNGAESHFTLGRMYFFAGQYARAIDSLRAAARINPHSRAGYSSHLAFSHLALGRTDVGVAFLETVVDRWPDLSPAHADLAIAYQFAGREAEARQKAESVPAIAPDVTMAVIERRFAAMQDKNLAARLIEAARQAGFPD